MIVDGHLDLAENVTIFGRDLTLDIAEIRAREGRTSRQATVSLPELRRGGVAVAIATVTGGFRAEDVGGVDLPPSAFYETPEEAETQALRQIDLYERWDAEGRVRLIRSSPDLDNHLELWRDDRVPGLVLLMEGADPIVHVDDLPRWWGRGLRIIGPAFGDTRYAAGVAVGSPTARPGGLTSDGVALLESMAELGFLWDVSHHAEEGVWQGLEMGFPRVCASHANARALIPTDRHLTDDVIRAIGERDGVIGLVLYNGFLDPDWEPGTDVSLEVLRRHADHVAGLAGWEHVGVGSDLDGGFGREESPPQIDTVADLGRVGDVLPDEARDGVLGGNWLRFLRGALPDMP